MPMRNKPLGINILVIMFAVMGIMNIFTGLFTASAATTLSALSWIFVGPLLTVFGLAVFLLGVLQLYTAYGIYERKPWARLAIIVFAVLGLFAFPLGTIISLIILILLISPEVRSYL